MSQGAGRSTGASPQRPLPTAASPRRPLASSTPSSVRRGTAVADASIATHSGAGQPTSSEARERMDADSEASGLESGGGEGGGGATVRPSMLAQRVFADAFAPPTVYDPDVPDAAPVSAATAGNVEGRILRSLHQETNVLRQMAATQEPKTPLTASTPPTGSTPQPAARRILAGAHAATQARRRAAGDAAPTPGTASPHPSTSTSYGRRSGGDASSTATRRKTLMTKAVPSRRPPVDPPAAAASSAPTGAAAAAAAAAAATALGRPTSPSVVAASVMPATASASAPASATTRGRKPAGPGSTSGLAKTEARGKSVTKSKKSLKTKKIKKSARSKGPPSEKANESNARKPSQGATSGSGGIGAMGGGEGSGRGVGKSANRKGVELHKTESALQVEAKIQAAATTLRKMSQREAVMKSLEQQAPRAMEKARELAAAARAATAGTPRMANISAKAAAVFTSATASAAPATASSAASAVPAASSAATAPSSAATAPSSAAAAPPSAAAAPPTAAAPSSAAAAPSSAAAAPSSAAAAASPAAAAASPAAVTASPAAVTASPAATAQPSATPVTRRPPWGSHVAARPPGTRGKSSTADSADSGAGKGTPASRGTGSMTGSAGGSGTGSGAGGERKKVVGRTAAVVASTARSKTRVDSAVTKSKPMGRPGPKLPPGTPEYSPMPSPVSPKVVSRSVKAVAARARVPVRTPRPTQGPKPAQGAQNAQGGPPPSSGDAGQSVATATPGPPVVKPLPRRRRPVLRLSESSEGSASEGETRKATGPRRPMPPKGRMKGGKTQAKVERTEEKGQEVDKESGGMSEGHTATDDTSPPPVKTRSSTKPRPLSGHSSDAGESEDQELSLRENDALILKTLLPPPRSIYGSGYLSANAALTATGTPVHKLASDLSDVNLDKVRQAIRDTEAVLTHLSGSGTARATSASAAGSATRNPTVDPSLATTAGLRAALERVRAASCLGPPATAPPLSPPPKHPAPQPLLSPPPHAPIARSPPTISPRSAPPSRPAAPFIAGGRISPTMVPSPTGDWQRTPGTPLPRRPRATILKTTSLQS